MKKKRVLLTLAAAGMLIGFPGAARGETVMEEKRMTTYYVDSLNGADSGDGRSPETAFQSVGRVNALRLEPGDSVLFRAGGMYSGTLEPAGTGEEGRSLTFGRYGEGPDPVLNAGGAFAAVRLRNMAYVRVSDFEITNLAPAQDAARCGVYVECGGAGTPGGIFREIHLRNLNVHDVVTVSGRTCGGIIFDTRAADHPVTYENVSIENCSVRNTRGNGITFTSAYSKRTGIDWATEPYAPSRSVSIRNNFVYNCGGDGIFQSCAVDPVIAHNTVYGTSWAGDTAYAGIWPHNSTNAVMAYNEAYGQRLVGGDGQGYDVDINCENTLVEHNYSHHNEGGFLLVCTSGDQGGWNKGVTVRYNISEDDRGQIFTLSGPVTDIRLHNNTVSFREGLNTRLIGMYQWGESGGGPDGVTAEDNIFAINGTGRNALYPDTRFRFSHNLYAGTYDCRNLDDRERIEADPLFAGETPLYGISTGSGFNLKKGSPAKADDGTFMGARP